MFRYPDVSVFSRRCCVALVSASLAGCLAVQVPDLPDQTPLSWSEPPAPQHAEVSLTHWWQAFDDPQLDALVEQVLRQNLDLQQAALRLRGEQAVAERWQGAFLPNLSANARPLQDVAAQDSYFHASIEMSWELGLFGAAENAELKAMADVGYAKSSYDAVMVAVVADVVRNYLDLGVARAQMALLAQTEALEQQAVRLARIRQQYHLGEQDELTQLLQQQQRARAAYAEMRGTADRAARGLALLLGQDTPDPAWQAIGQAPVLAPFSLAQVPADLLRTRPDIRSAEAEVMHAVAELGLARSALYPRLNLGGSILYSYNVTQNVRTSTDNVPSIGPIIDIPLWSWGTRRARVKASESELDAALLGYRKAVLAGVAEVENALALLARQSERITAYEAVMRQVGARGAQLETRLGLGLDSDFDQLAWQREKLAGQGELLWAEAGRSLAFVALFKALGGAPLSPQETR